MWNLTCPIICWTFVAFMKNSTQLIVYSTALITGDLHVPINARNTDVNHCRLLCFQRHKHQLLLCLAGLRCNYRSFVCVLSTVRSNWVCIISPHHFKAIPSSSLGTVNSSSNVFRSLSHTHPPPAFYKCLFFWTFSLNKSYRELKSLDAHLWGFSWP